ncbi:serine hydrolase [Streptomyces sp. NPDC057592]|uniref:serine hydrolase n=1 Tax=unclassified Streptomyces TaxID=2593676 RepID=UPI003674B5BE
MNGRPSAASTPAATTCSSSFSEGGGQRQQRPPRRGRIAAVQPAGQRRQHHLRAATGEHGAGGSHVLRTPNAVLERLDTFTTGPPGGEAEYSNLGYAVLGAALSAAADAPYEELLNRHVLTTLNITEVTSNPPPAGRLSGRGFLGLRLRPWNMSGAILPAGGMWATPRETAQLVNRCDFPAGGLLAGDQSARGSVSA